MKSNTGFTKATRRETTKTKENNTLSTEEELRNARALTDSVIEDSQNTGITDTNTQQTTVVERPAPQRRGRVPNEHRD